jgi:hypothetical protein
MAHTILDIRMFSAGTGWLLTEGALYHTDDGGKVWHRVRILPRGRQQGSVVTPSGQVVWVTKPATHGVTKVFSSRDGGVHWTSGTLPQGTELVAATGVYGWTRPSPWLLANQYAPAPALYRSDNRGQQWSKIQLFGPLDARQALELGRVTFVSRARGFVFGQFPVEGVPLFFGTTDGGRSWLPIRLGVPRDKGDAAITVMRPRFFGRTGIVLVYFSNPHRQTAVIYVSQDGGQTWTTSGTARPFQLNPDGFIGSCGSATDCAVVSGGLQVWLTHNGGHTWFAASLPAAMQNIRKIDWVSQHVGWAASLHHLWKTTNGGYTWHPVTLNYGKQPAV